MKKGIAIKLVGKPRKKRPGIHSKKNKPAKRYRGQGK